VPLLPPPFAEVDLDWRYDVANGFLASLSNSPANKQQSRGTVIKKAVPVQSGYKMHIVKSLLITHCTAGTPACFGAVLCLPR
jgi:hypothetical protein